VPADSHKLANHIRPGRRRRLYLAVLVDPATLPLSEAHAGPPQARQGSRCARPAPPACGPPHAPAIPRRARLDHLNVLRLHAEPCRPQMDQPHPFSSPFFASATGLGRQFFLLKSGVELTTHSVKLTKLTSIPKINRSISEAATFTFGRFATNFGP
jgi:hypothetical protein